MLKQERLSGTGGGDVFGSCRRSDCFLWDRFEHLDAPVFIPAGSCLRLDFEGEESVVAIKVVVRGGIWK